MFRVHAKRCIDHLLWFTGQVVTGQNAQQFCVVYQNVRVSTDKRASLFKGLLRLVITPHCLVGACQHGPSRRVVRVVVEFDDQRLDHLFDLFIATVRVAAVAGSGNGIDGCGCAEFQINAKCQDGHAQTDDSGCAFGAPETNVLVSGRGCFETFCVVEQAQLQFFARGLKVLLADDPTGQIGFQGMELVTVNGGVEFVAGDAFTFGFAKQRVDHPGHHQQCQNC